MSARYRDDGGQTSVLVSGVTVVLLLFALTIAAITAVTLQHRKLLSLADSAAQRAATSFTIADPDTLSLTLTPDTARRQVVEHLAEIGAEQQFSGLQIDLVNVVDETTVNVELSAMAHPPIVNWVLPSGVQVTAEGTARTQLEP